MSSLSEGKSAIPQMTLPADTIIIGFTGLLGSGCSFVAEGMKTVWEAKARYYRLSDILRRKARETGIERPTTRELQDLGDTLRQEQGVSTLVEQCITSIKEEIEKKSFNQSEDSIVLIDGVRNDGEVRFLRQFPNFYLFSVHATTETREKRTVGPGKRFASHGEFLDADERDKHEHSDWGQQVQRCNDVADVIINNDDSFARRALIRQREFFQELVNNYGERIIAVSRGEQTHERPPRVDETLMSMAYCVSKRSRCLKRKVGAIIAYVPAIEGATHARKPVNGDVSFQVLSSGYNDVPLGTKPCFLEDYGDCYRNHLQNQYSTLIKYCPNCGTEIRSEDRGFHDNYVCGKCGCKVYENFMPGAKKTPGKLLDMCRSLHAEENAILGLAGTSKVGSGELILYSTTFPCNLCANKIVAVGIKRVVFAEPYSMEESRRVLSAAGVKVEAFQGVKSTAYFRFYT